MENEKEQNVAKKTKTIIMKNNYNSKIVAKYKGFFKELYNTILYNESTDINKLARKHGISEHIKQFVFESLVKDENGRLVWIGGEIENNIDDIMCKVKDFYTRLNEKRKNNTRPPKRKPKRKPKARPVISDTFDIDMYNKRDMESAKMICNKNYYILSHLMKKSGSDISYLHSYLSEINLSEFECEVLKKEFIYAYDSWYVKYDKVDGELLAAFIMEARKLYNTEFHGLLYGHIMKYLSALSALYELTKRGCELSLDKFIKSYHIDIDVKPTLINLMDNKGSETTPKWVWAAAKPDKEFAGIVIKIMDIAKESADKDNH